MRRTQNAWICMECSWNNLYKTDPEVCKKCSKPIPHAPLNAPYNKDPKYQANTDPPMKTWKCTEVRDCSSKNNRWPFYNLEKFNNCQKCGTVKPWDCPRCGKNQQISGKKDICLKYGCLGLKREPTLNLSESRSVKHIKMMDDGLLKQYPYQLIKDEL